MTQEGPDEHCTLVDLWRQLSPASLSVEVPRLPPDLEARSQKSLPRRPRAILFDVYGTLLVSAAGGEPNLAGGKTREGIEAGKMLESELETIGFSGGAMRFADELARRIGAERQAQMARTPHPEVDIEQILSELVPDVPISTIRRLAILNEASTNPCSTMPGASDLLIRLAHQGLGLGIISNAQFYTPLLVEALFGATPEHLGFEPQLTVYSYQLKTAKPSAQPFARAARILEASNILPPETLFIGNSSTNDIAPARELGFLTALFAGDTRSFRPSEPGTPGALPDLVLKTWDELPEKILF